MFCSMYFPLYQPWSFLVFEHPDVWGLQQKQPQITKKTDFEKPQITESNLGLFLLNRQERRKQLKKMVAPHLMCSRIFFR